MANVFKNSTGEGSTAGTAVYTVPASTTAIILGLNLSNKVSATETASVLLGSTYIIKDAPIPVGSSLSVLDGKIIAEAAETITVTTSADTAIDVIVSVMEQS